MSEDIHVDPPQLVTAGAELVAAGLRLDDARAYADRQPALAVEAGGVDAGVAAFRESWAEHAAALRGLSRIVTYTVAGTAAAAEHCAAVEDAVRAAAAAGRPVPGSPEGGGTGSPVVGGAGGG